MHRDKTSTTMMMMMMMTVVVVVVVVLAAAARTSGSSYEEQLHGKHTTVISVHETMSKLHPIKHVCRCIDISVCSDILFRREKKEDNEEDRDIIII